MKDVEKLIKSEFKDEYKCENISKLTQNRPQTFKSVFSYIFEENNRVVKLTNINDILNSLV